MASMTMNKAIHCAVRRDLSRFATAAAEFAEGDKARAAALGRAWDNFEAQLTHHHEGEHEIAWPALLALGVGRELVDSLDAEHEAMAAALHDAGAAMTTFRCTASGTDAAAFGTALAQLERVTAAHLGHEEEAIEQLMLDRAEDPVIKEMGKKFGKGPIGEAGTFLAWVLDGTEPEARQAIESYVPKPVIVIIGGLFGRGYRRDVAPVWR